MACAGLGCGDDLEVARDAAIDTDAAVDAPALPLAFVDGPTISLASAAPLTAQLTLTTSRPTRVSIAITDAERSFTITRPALGTAHTLPVLGFRADTVHAVVVTATAEDGEAITAAALEVVTAPLPAGFPVFTTDRVVPAQIEPGLTLTGIRSYVVAVDDLGTVVWFVDTGRGPSDIRQLPSGNLLVSYRDLTGGAEIDVSGNVLRQWHTSNTSAGLPGSVAVATDSFHHELGVLASGDLFTLSSERRTFTGYPTSEIDPTPQTEPQDVIGDVALVFAPDGTILHEWSLFDILDPHRLAYNSFGTFWSSFYAPSGAIDWSHGNALIPDPSDGGYLISLRHQDAVIKLDAGGDLVWILGTHDNWSAAFAPYLLTPVGAPFAWQFHQHAPKILPNGNILLFDNGNYRVSPPTTPPATNYSRAVEYTVDATRMEVEQVWEYDAGGTIFATATGDVDVGPVTGNIITTFGTARRIVEVTYTDPAVVVFELFADDTIYRAERVTSLYPAL